MRIVDLIGCMGWVAAFLAAIAAIPVAGLFVGLLTPLPFIYYITGLPFRYAAQFAALVVGILAAIAMAVGLHRLALFCLEFGALGLALSQLFQRRISIGRVIFYGTAVLMGVGLLVIMVTAIAHHIGPLDAIRAYLDRNLRMSFEAYQSMGIPPEKAAEIKAYGDLLRRTVLQIYPALMTIGSAFVVWVNVLLSLRLFRAKGRCPDQWDRLTDWSAPEILVWGVIISGFSLFLPLTSIRFIAINLLLILMTAYLFQGIAILSHFLNRFGAPGWLRVVIYFFISVQQFFLALLALAGLFDQWVNFRRIGKGNTV
ncbi:MAG: hypothetical protein DRG63_00490 [Deltaproteobacteria bacterium]|nr:MAG: hypothetical protein DRG63_00490 [Deltaproteobacteria bacterium]